MNAELEMPFKAMMRELVNDVPGATGAIFVDWEGESVDNYSVDEDTYQLKVVGAYKGVILNIINEAQRSSGSGPVKCVIVKMENFNILMTPVKDGYHVVLVVENGSLLSRAAFRMEKIVHDLIAEM